MYDFLFLTLKIIRNIYKNKYGIPISRQPKIIGITGHFSAEVRELGI